MNTIKDFATSSISNLACCKFVASKENTHSFQNYYRNQTKHTPQGVFYGGSRFTTKEGTRELLDKSKQIFCSWCTFSQFYDHDYFKELIVINSLITKQCPVELSPPDYTSLYSLSGQKSFPSLYLACYPQPCMDCPIPTPNLPFGGSPVGGGRTQANSKQKIANFPH